MDEKTEELIGWLATANDAMLSQIALILRVQAQEIAIAHEMIDLDKENYDKLKEEFDAQAQEIERLKGDLTSASIDRHYSRQEQLERAEAAESRVRELEERVAELYRAEKNSFLSLKANGETIAAIEAKTIERCAQVAESKKPAAMSPEVQLPMTAREIATAIRALAKTT